MSKILLALAILSSGGGAFVAARQSTTLLRREVNESRTAWLTQTQLVAVAERDRTDLIERVRHLKEALAQAPTATESPLWSALQTNRVGHLPPELRERLFEELGFNWKLSEDFIVVSKETIHNILMTTIQDGKLTDIASTVLAMTAGERGQVEAAIQRVRTDFNDWAGSHTERTEPKDDMVAQYTLHNDTSLSISNRFAAALLQVVGKERAELILPSARNYLMEIGIHRGDTIILKVTRYLIGNETRHKFETSDWKGTEWYGTARPRDVLKGGWFPPAFRPVFPNGWADVAKREGFELPPEEPQEK
jgi:hypothetical protein